MTASHNSQPPADFAAVVVGDSMAPFIQEKDTLVFSPQRKVSNGDIVILKETDGIFHLGRYYKAGKIVRLARFNTKYKTMEVNLSNIEYVYRAVAVYRTLSDNDAPFVRWQKKQS